MYRNILIYPRISNNQDKIFTNDLIFDIVCGLLQAPNNQYDSRYDLSSANYSLTRDVAVTRHGQIALIKEPES